MHTSSEQKFAILSAVFVAALIAANLLGTKITTILGISVSVGIFAYPLTFLITDAIEEVFGKDKAKQLMYSALVAQILVLIIVAIAVVLPPAARYEHNDAYTLVFSNSIRIIVASLIAFFVSQTHDIWAFNFWKEKTHGKFLWLRNNASTIISQFIDTVIFMFIAFYHVTPKFDAVFLFSLIIPYWLFKVAFALIDTPIIYVLVAWLKHPNNSAHTETR
ncbi:transporter [bacterium CG10_46_32]|nr:MAG: transporter [bacterium CG10_46_32]PIR56463.1 MAG: transporter [Parcubacteria group bacterium CG10_big_fil_rev_8_21_14_0_10_46_32]